MIVKEKRYKKIYNFYNQKGQKISFVGCPPTRTNNFEWNGQIFELREVTFREI